MTHPSGYSSRTATNAAYMSYMDIVLNSYAKIESKNDQLIDKLVRAVETGASAQLHKLTPIEELASYEKLRGDGFLKGTDDGYEITMKGFMFSHDGGYKQQYVDTLAKRARVEEVEKQTLKLHRRMVLLTWLLAIGTGISAICQFCLLFCESTK